MKLKKIEYKDGLDGKKHRKEDKFRFAYVLLAIVEGDIKEIAEYRGYFSPKQAYVYGCLWVNGKGCSGSARGDFYNHPAQDVFKSAGIEFENFNGDLPRALELIGEHLGHTGLYVVHSHA